MIKVGYSREMNESYKIEGDRSYEGARYVIVSGPNASDAPFMNKLRAKGFEVSPSGYNNRCWVYYEPSDQTEFKDFKKNLTKILKSMDESINDEMENESFLMNESVSGLLAAALNQTDKAQKNKLTHFF